MSSYLVRPLKSQLYKKDERQNIMKIHIKNTSSKGLGIYADEDIPANAKHGCQASMVRAIRNRSSFSGVVSYSTVSKVNTRFSAKLEKDRKIRRDVQEIMRESVTSQGLTHWQGIR